MAVNEHKDLARIRATEMHAACVRGHEEVVSRLLDRGAEINLVADDHSTLLYVATGTRR